MIVLKTSWRYLCNTSWRRLEDVLKTFLQDVLKTSWRRIAKTNILVLTKTSWRRLEDVFWRRKAKANIFVLIKTSSRRLLKTKTKDVFKTSSRRFHQDECLLGSDNTFVFQSLLKDEAALKIPFFPVTALTIPFHFLFPEPALTMSFPATKFPNKLAPKVPNNILKNSPIFRLAFNCSSDSF